MVFLLHPPNLSLDHPASVGKINLILIFITVVVATSSINQSVNPCCHCLLRLVMMVVGFEPLVHMCDCVASNVVLYS